MSAISGEHWTVHNGDCRAVFRALPAKSVHCIVTSPPYWGGVRDYGIGPSVWGGDAKCDHSWRETRSGTVCEECSAWLGCFGNEPLVEQYVEHTLEIFDALGHALRDEGTIWWNIGDCFFTGKGSMHNPGGGEVSLHGRLKDAGALVSGAAPNRMPQSIRAGNKSLVPFRVALALQEAGWIIRQDNIWRKPSPMPESIDGWRWEPCRVRVAPSARSTYDRHIECDPNGKPHSERNGKAFVDQSERFRPCPGCDKCRDNGGMVLRRGSWRSTTAHEFVFQITKGPEYFSDANAASEKASENTNPRGSKMKPPKQDANAADGNGHDRFISYIPDVVETRNPRSVWTISSEAYKGKHFAAFPTMLAWKCIQASTSAGGCCPTCGSQYAPVVEKGRVATRPALDSKVWKQDAATATDGQRSTASPNRDPYRHIAVKRTTGYRATCNCNAGDPVPCVVADPFTGSGTTLQVSINTGRQFVGSEIAPHYLPLIQERADTPWAPKEAKKPAVKRRKKHKREQALFT